MGTSEGAECIHNSLINLYRSEPKNIYKFSSYFTENSPILHYQYYSVRIVFKTSIINLRTIRQKNAGGTSMSIYYCAVKTSSFITKMGEFNIRLYYNHYVLTEITYVPT
jgi:hypothetical protein